MNKANICRYISMIAGAVGVILLLAGLGTFGTGMDLDMYWLGLIIIIGAILFDLIFVRCPFCKRYLGMRQIHIRHCPYCGGKGSEWNV